MSAASAQTDAPLRDTDLAGRCERLGVALLAVDLDGGAAPVGRVPLSAAHRAVATSPMFRSHLRQVAAHWAEQARPRCTEVWPGCWVLPVERTQRRRRTGYFVGLLLTAQLAHAEQFRHACDAARLDFITACRRLDARTGVTTHEAEALATTIAWLAADLDDLGRKTDEIDTLTRHLGETYEELSLVYKLSAHMMVTQQPEEFLGGGCAELHQVLGARWVALHLCPHDERMGAMAGRLLLSGDLPVPAESLSQTAQHIVDSYAHAEPVIVNDTAQTNLADLAGIASQMLIVPVRVEQRTIGVLLTADKSNGTDFSSVDAKLATAAAQNMGIFLENAILYEDAQDLFMGTLHALIASIDAKDSYTCGHSERVAWLSRELAERAGLDAQTVERVYLSALVHDVGKIGVPEAVLCKPGKLTDEEFSMIKAHPEIGARILKDIRQMRDLIPGVLHHHERYDGRGYPHGLAGEAIPLFGRLICLADSFDAMSSNRTYRSALNHEKVLAEIERCAGAQFDPGLAEVFLTIDFGGFFDLLGEHQKRESPLRQAMRSTT